VETRLTPHSMRHSFATHHVLNGKGAKWVSEQLGHASPSITLDVYAASFRMVDPTAADELADTLCPAVGDKVGDTAS